MDKPHINYADSYGSLTEISCTKTTKDDLELLIVEAITDSYEQIVLILSNGKIEFGFGRYRKENKKNYLSHSEADLIYGDYLENVIDLLSYLLKLTGIPALILGLPIDCRNMSKKERFRHYIKEIESLDFSTLSLPEYDH